MIVAGGGEQVGVGRRGGERPELALGVALAHKVNLGVVFGVYLYYVARMGAHYDVALCAVDTSHHDFFVTCFAH